VKETEILKVSVCLVVFSSCMENAPCTQQAASPMALTLLVSEWMEVGGQET